MTHTYVANEVIVQLCNPARCASALTICAPAGSAHAHILCVHTISACKICTCAHIMCARVHTCPCERAHTHTHTHTHRARTGPAHNVHIHACAFMRAHARAHMASCDTCARACARACRTRVRTWARSEHCVLIEFLVIWRKKQNTLRSTIALQRFPKTLKDQPSSDRPVFCARRRIERT